MDAAKAAHLLHLVVGRASRAAVRVRCAVPPNVQRNVRPSCRTIRPMLHCRWRALGGLDR